MYHTEPPTDKTIRESYMNSSRVAACALRNEQAVRAHRPLVQKETWRDSLRIDMLLSAVSVLVVAQSSSEIPEELKDNPVLYNNTMRYTLTKSYGRVNVKTNSAI